MSSATGEKSQIQVGIFTQEPKFLLPPSRGWLAHSSPPNAAILALSAPSGVANDLNLDNVLLHLWPGCPPTAFAIGPRCPEWPIGGLLALNSATFSILHCKHTDWVVFMPHSHGVTVPTLSAQALYWALSNSPPGCLRSDTAIICAWQFSCPYLDQATALGVPQTTQTF